MRKLIIAVTLLALARWLYVLLNTDASDNELASPADTRTGDAAAANAARLGLLPNVQAAGSETRPAPVRMSSTGTIIGAR